MNNPDQQSVYFRLLSFRIVNYRYREPKPENQRLRTGKYNFKFRVEPNKEKEEVTVGMIANLFIGKKEPESVANIETESIFKVNGLKEFPSDEGSITIPRPILEALLAIHYSTTRGAMIGKGAGTAAEKIPMPIKMATDLLPKKDLVPSPD